MALVAKPDWLKRKNLGFPFDSPIEALIARGANHLYFAAVQLAAIQLPPHLLAFQVNQLKTNPALYPIAPATKQAIATPDFDQAADSNERAPAVAEDRPH